MSPVKKQRGKKKKAGNPKLPDSNLALLAQKSFVSSTIEEMDLKVKMEKAVDVSSLKLPDIPGYSNMKLVDKKKKLQAVYWEALKEAYAKKNPPSPEKKKKKKNKTAVKPHQWVVGPAAKNRNAISFKFSGEVITINNMYDVKVDPNSTKFEGVPLESNSQAKKRKRVRKPKKKGDKTTEDSKNVEDESNKTTGE